MFFKGISSFAVTHVDEVRAGSGCGIAADDESLFHRSVLQPSRLPFLVSDANDSSTKTRIIRGVAVGWIAQACGLMVTFITTPIVIHGLGDAKYGIWSIVMSLTGYYGLADLGLGKATAKYLAQYDAVGDRETVQRILGTTIRTYCWLAAAVAAIAMGLAWWFPVLFGTGGLPDGTVGVVVLLIGLRVAVQLLGSTYRCALIAHKRFDLTNVLSIVSQVGTAVCIVIIIELGGGLGQMALAVFAVSVLVQGITWRLAVHKLDLPSFSLGDANDETRKMMLGFGLLTVVANSAQQLARNSGAIIGGMIAGPAAVAYFSVAQTISQKFLVLGKPIGQAVLPTASQLQAQDRSEKLRELTEQVLRILLALAFVFVTIIWVFGYQFVSKWIDVPFAQQSYQLFCILVLALVASLPGSSMQQILQGLGRVRFVATLGVVEAICVVVLAVPLTYAYGMVGMAFTLLLTTLVYRGLVQGWYLLSVTEIPKTRFVSVCMIPALASTIPVVGAAFLLRATVPEGGLFQVILQMATVMMVAGVSIFLLCLPAETRRTAVSAILGTRFGGLITWSLSKR